MKPLLKVLWTSVKVLFVAAAALFAVYYWDLDQKVIDWVYLQAYRIRDRRNADAKP